MTTRNLFNRKALALAVALTVGGSTAFAADDTRGYLQGSVTAQTGPVAGATVTIVHEGKGTSRTVVTNADGTYRIPALATGAYTITVTKDGQVLDKTEHLAVGIGDRTVFNVDQSVALEEVVVLGKSTVLDTSSAVKDFVVDAEELATQVPVPRNIRAVALLAPAAHEGDKTFGTNNHDYDAISLGGASIAENACFVNGLNITNFRNGLGCSELPYGFYDQIQIKTGGYGAEYGRSLGGVLNATTKSGTNEFKYGFRAFWQPDTFTEDSPDTFRAFNRFDERDETDVELWASGPIIEDKLFFFVLANPNYREARDTSNSIRFNSENEDTFWGAKLDWNITDNHSLEYTAFSDAREEEETQHNFDIDTGVGTRRGVATYKRGGENHIVKWTGQWNEWLTSSVLYGINKYERHDIANPADAPLAFDFRSGTREDIGFWVTQIPSRAEDEREVFRADFDVILGAHTIRFGYDYEKTELSEDHFYSGGNRFDLFVDEVWVWTLQNEGTFEADSTAIYIQDTWELNEHWTFNAGIRSSEFTNDNKVGDTYIDIDDQVAPRLGVTFDPSGDGRQRIYANWGRYFLPVASNTSIRLGGDELFTIDFYDAPGYTVAEDGTPDLSGATFLGTALLANGELLDTRTIVDQDLDPMYQDEIIIGYDWTGDEWGFGVRYVNRELKSALEDIALDTVLLEYAAANGFDDFSAGGFTYYVLTNPGDDATIDVDIDGDGDLDTITVDTGLTYPDAEREYEAVELTFERFWDGKWTVKGSYVWSRLTGNLEGFVRSDNGQDDAGLTTNFDLPGLTDLADGYLPQDRRHTVKIFGAYRFDNGIQVGANLLWRDGRPINGFGVHPTDPYAPAYGAESFFVQGEGARRGSFGRTSNIWRLDLSAQYQFELMGADSTVRVDVFNVFNNDDEIEVWELGDLDNGDPDPNHMKPTAYQNPRAVRFSISMDF